MKVERTPWFLILFLSSPMLVGYVCDEDATVLRARRSLFASWTPKKEETDQRRQAACEHTICMHALTAHGSDDGGKGGGGGGEPSRTGLRMGEEGAGGARTCLGICRAWGSTPPSEVNWAWVEEAGFCWRLWRVHLLSLYLSLSLSLPLLLLPLPPPARASVVSPARAHSHRLVLANSALLLLFFSVS